MAYKPQSANIIIAMKSPLLLSSVIIGFNNRTMCFLVKLPQGTFLVELWNLREADLKLLQGGFKDKI